MENISEEQRIQWLREQFQKACAYLGQQGVIFESVVVEDSRYTVPQMAIWKMKAQDGQGYWVVGGEVMSDHTLLEQAEDARAALRFFALNWQMRAENQSRSAGPDQEKQQQAKQWQGQAELLYQLADDDGIWQ